MEAAENVSWDLADAVKILVKEIVGKEATFSDDICKHYSRSYLFSGVFVTSNHELTMSKSF